MEVDSLDKKDDDQRQERIEKDAPQGITATKTYWKGLEYIVLQTNMCQFCGS